MRCPMCEGSGFEKTYPYVVEVLFDNAGKPYSFGTTYDNLPVGEKVVVETAQGQEIGVVAKASIPANSYSRVIPLKPVIRIADEQDIEDAEENVALAKEAFQTCNEMIHSLGLDMRLLSADYTLDRAKVLFIYLSDQRVDFRELLKKLGAQLHCRVELRQIGERDKAKMVGGIGICGRECCCSKFKSHFDVISISMAKTQLLALNMEKLSGQCGKLMCCLKYENENYKELTAGLPKMGAHVEYGGDLYKVTAMNVMSNEARIENATTVQTITLEDLRENGTVRKGVAMAKREPGNKQKRTVINNTNTDAPQKVEDKLHETLHKQVAQEAKREQEKKAEKPKTENRKFTANNNQKNAGSKNPNSNGRSDKKPNNGNRSHQNNNRKPNNGSHSNLRPQENPKPNPQNKNTGMSVRTFKAKKESE